MVTCWSRRAARPAHGGGQRWVQQGPWGKRNSFFPRLFLDHLVELVEFVAWREHGCRWTESLMAGVVPGDMKRQFAALRAASSRGPAKAKLSVEDMVQVGEDVYARRNHQLAQIMRLPMQDWRRAVYAFLRGDTPFCPPGGRIQRRPPWNPFAGLPSNLQATSQKVPLHALLVLRSYIAHGEAMSLLPHWMAAVAQAFSQWIGSWVAQDVPAFREWSRVVSAQSSATVRGTMVRGPDGQSDSWLQVYTNHPAVGNVMGWPREVLPVLQQPLCGLPILAVAVVLDVGTLWLDDRQLRRAIPGGHRAAVHGRVGGLQAAHTVTGR